MRARLVRRSLTSMSEASLVRRRAGSLNLREARWTLSRGGQTRVGRAQEVLRMECKDSTCREGEVLGGSRGADRLVTKVVTKEVIKEAIKEAIVEAISEAHRVMVAVDITRATVTRTTTNSSPTKKEEGGRANLGLSGGRACIAWPNTGRLVA